MRALTSLNLTGWQIPKVTTSTQLFYYNYNLKDVIGPLPLSMGHTYAYCEALTHQSTLNILNALPTVSKATTINIGSYANNQLTAAERAIATAKGWTVAN